jgi:hypothetical protein
VVHLLLFSDLIHVIFCVVAILMFSDFLVFNWYLVTVLWFVFNCLFFTYPSMHTTAVMSNIYIYYSVFSSSTGFKHKHSLSGIILLI